MTIIAKFPVELDGHIYHKGDSCAYDGGITPRIAANFTDANGEPLSIEKDSAVAAPQAAPDGESAGKAAVENTIKVMGREGIKRALDAMNITYSPSANTPYLARTLLIARGEIEP